MVLAVGWAAYLLPKALKRHDDLSMSRPVETFSDSVRVVGASTAKPAPTAEPVPEAEHVETPVAKPSRAHRITRESARRAARRRRRVLALRVLALIGVGVASHFAYTPWWSTAVPGGLVVTFLVVARLTVRAQQVRRAAPVQSSRDTAGNAGAPAEAVEPKVPSRATAPAFRDGRSTTSSGTTEVEPDLGREDTQGLSREQLAEAVAVPVLDDGGLWDPLPVTLPTYVSKARARRTVRTIEITGITSSGHDVADSELARTAEEAEATQVETEAGAEDRKAAGA